MTDKSNYCVQHFRADSVKEIAEKIQSFFDSVSVVADVHYSYRNLSYFTVQEVDTLRIPNPIVIKYEAVLTLRVRQKDADVSL